MSDGVRRIARPIDIALLRRLWCVSYLICELTFGCQEKLRHTEAAFGEPVVPLFTHKSKLTLFVKLPHAPSKLQINDVVLAQTLSNFLLHLSLSRSLVPNQNVPKIYKALHTASHLIPFLLAVGVVNSN
jgi:hypothetical protein